MSSCRELDDSVYDGTVMFNGTATVGGTEHIM